MWVRKWTVPSNSNPNKTYIVAQDNKGQFGCSCPAWKFHRKQCKHIQRIMNQTSVQQIVPQIAQEIERQRNPKTTSIPKVNIHGTIPFQLINKRKFNFDE